MLSGERPDETTVLSLPACRSLSSLFLPACLSVSFSLFTYLPTYLTIVLLLSVYFFPSLAMPTYLNICLSPFHSISVYISSCILVSSYLSVCLFHSFNCNCLSTNLAVFQPSSFYLFLLSFCQSVSSSLSTSLYKLIVTCRPSYFCLLLPLILSASIFLSSVFPFPQL